jgi:hypothetical protein
MRDPWKVQGSEPHSWALRVLHISDKAPNLPES